MEPTRMTHGIRKGPPGSTWPLAVGETFPLRHSVRVGPPWIFVEAVRSGDVGIFAEVAALGSSKCVEKWNVCFPYAPILPSASRAFGVRLLGTKKTPDLTTSIWSH